MYNKLIISIEPVVGYYLNVLLIQQSLHNANSSSQNNSLSDIDNSL